MGLADELEALEGAPKRSSGDWTDDELAAVTEERLAAQAVHCGWQRDDLLALLARRERLLEERETVVLSRAEFDALPEYSMSMPASTRVGKRWRRNRNANGRGAAEPEWWMGEYQDVGSDAEVGIRWRRITVVP